MGGKINHSMNNGGGPPTYSLNGQNYHKIGTLLPPEGQIPRFAQLYIYDTCNEVSNRIKSNRITIDDRRTFHDVIVRDLQLLLDQSNILVKSFRMAREKICEGQCTNVRLRLIGKRGGDGRTYNLPSVDEVAALLVGDFDETMGSHDIIVETRDMKPHRISELHPSYLPLQYPLLFPFGEDGYRPDILLAFQNFDEDGDDDDEGRKYVSMREYFAFRVQSRIMEVSLILHSKRLFQQFVVDAYTMVEYSRLIYIRTHQKELRCELYSGLTDALLRGETNAALQGQRVILPSSFTGGARYMIQNYQDAMAICRWAGYPNLFITFTCNPKWPEISRYVQSKGLNPEDRPDIMCRVFKMKLDMLIADLRKKELFGKVRAVIYTVEFQKRGLPHAHILLFINKDYSGISTADIDKIISAEIPNEELDPTYYAVVRDCMVHGPCGVARPNSPCMKDGKCTKHYPKKFVDATCLDEDGYPIYRRRNDGRNVLKNDVTLDNRHVVPHNRYLLMKYGAHINVEWCNQSRSIKYLFKYVNKGNDHVTASFYSSASETDNVKQVDEVDMYYDCRYISPCEACWRIFGFQIQHRDPPVQRLGFHLPNQQSIIFSDNDALEKILARKTLNQNMFLGWFEANKVYDEARELTYAQFPQKFVWKRDKKAWVPRKQRFSIGRMYYVPPGSGEVYYLRCLLNVVKGPRSYEEIRMVDGILYSTFRDACCALGLVDDDKEYIDAIIDASNWSSETSLRNLFATLLSSGSFIRPEYVWERCWTYLSADILYQQRKLLQYPDLQLTDQEIRNYALAEIEKLLRSRGRSLHEFPTVPYPRSDYFHSSDNTLINDEMCYDRRHLNREHGQLLSKLTDEQRHVYSSIIESVQNNTGGMFFVYGYGGTGKTFIWRTLSAAIRSRGDIVLNVASSGIASLLLPGGRTAHSRFKIPIIVNEDSMCKINQGSPLAQLLIQCKLIIWDEAPMTHKHCFEALDRSMRDILRVSNNENHAKPFGGKTIVFGGDFRQILPVISKGTRQDIVLATINSSYLWSSCKVLRLTKNMRVSNGNDSDSIAIEEFSKWIADIGDGKVGGPNDGCADIEIPSDLLVDGGSNPIGTIVETIYPAFATNNCQDSILEERAILAPTLEVVESINQYMIAMNEGDEKIYLSADSACQSDMNASLVGDLHTTEYLNSIRSSGIPNHELILKVGTPIMLLRNIDHANGLCNGTRLIVTRLGNRLLEAKTIHGKNAGQTVLIPRVSLTPSDTRLPFKFQRRQFPVMVSYAMTINKSQGQSLSQVGIFLKKPVFSHGQLYVAMSRVRSRAGLKIMLCNSENTQPNITTNVVYKEVFENV